MEEEKEKAEKRRALEEGRKREERRLQETHEFNRTDILSVGTDETKQDPLDPFRRLQDGFMVPLITDEQEVYRAHCIYQATLMQKYAMFGMLDKVQEVRKVPIDTMFAMRRKLLIFKPEEELRSAIGDEGEMDRIFKSYWNNLDKIQWMLFKTPLYIFPCCLLSHISPVPANMLSFVQEICCINSRCLKSPIPLKSGPRGTFCTGSLLFKFPCCLKSHFTACWH